MHAFEVSMFQARLPLAVELLDIKLLEMETLQTIHLMAQKNNLLTLTHFITVWWHPMRSQRELCRQPNGTGDRLIRHVGQ